MQTEKIDTFKIKEWYANQRGVRLQTPNWSATKMFDEEGIYIIPYSIPLEKASATFEQYLVVFEDTDGNIVSGMISTIVYDKKDLLVLDLTKKKELLLMNNIPNDFTGSLLQYKLDGSLVKSNSYKQGKVITDLKIVLSEKAKPGKTVTMNLFTTSIACGDWVAHYIVEYNTETGEVYDWIYLYTEYGVCPPSDGGGGSGGDGGNGDGEDEPPVPTCAELEMMVNTGSATAVLESETTLHPQATTKEKVYKWKCVQGVGWKVVSLEKAYLKKIPNVAPNIEWEYTSSSHLSDYVEGNFTGGTITPTLNYANHILGKYNLKVDHSISVVATTTLAGCSSTNASTHNSVMTFNVSSPANPGY